jgi:hypothetical protein
MQRGGVKMARRIWSVKHRDGWCRCKGYEKPEESATNIETLCGYLVVLPLEIERCKPTCKECLGKRK